jgi:uncharacterized delta-60 repeat protein
MNYRVVAFFLALVVLILLAVAADAQVSETWVARYNGPGNSDDEAYSLAVDAFGNVYVTGGSWGSGTGLDYATIKYDSCGVSQWVRRYNGPGNSDDYASSISVDANGNVYVTGYSMGAGSGNDYATIKYNSSGVQQWVARYNGPGNSDDYASGIAVDANGNSYVTGGSFGTGSEFDYATVKYNSSGVQQWVSRYNGPGNAGDFANSMAIDSSGNVYVAGGSFSSGSYPSDDYATIKYNSAGTQQWVARYNGAAGMDDYATSVAVDVGGNVYVTGASFTTSAEFSYVTLKYNSSGVQQWLRGYNAPGLGSGDVANCIALDIDGNVYVTGSSVGVGTNNDFATIKYNSSGTQQWVARYNGTGNLVDEAYSLVVDASLNVYVTGKSGTQFGMTDDYVTLKYDSSGIQQWVATYNGPANSNDAAKSLKLDANGNVYVTGYSAGTGSSHDYATIKYQQGTPSGPENIDDLTIELSGTNAILTWCPVVLDTLGNPITVTHYGVFMSLTDPRFIPTPADSIGVVFPPDTTYVDIDALTSSQRFYDVKAVSENR